MPQKVLRLNFFSSSEIGTGRDKSENNRIEKKIVRDRRQILLLVLGKVKQIYS